MDHRNTGFFSRRRTVLNQKCIPWMVCVLQQHLLQSIWSIQPWWSVSSKRRFGDVFQSMSEPSTIPWVTFSWSINVSGKEIWTATDTATGTWSSNIKQTIGQHQHIDTRISYWEDWPVSYFNSSRAMCGFHNKTIPDYRTSVCVDDQCRLELSETIHECEVERSLTGPLDWVYFILYLWWCLFYHIQKWMVSMRSDGSRSE